MPRSSLDSCLIRANVVSRRCGSAIKIPFKQIDIRRSLAMRTCWVIRGEPRENKLLKDSGERGFRESNQRR